MATQTDEKMARSRIKDIKGIRLYVDTPGGVQPARYTRVPFREVPISRVVERYVVDGSPEAARLDAVSTVTADTESLSEAWNAILTETLHPGRRRLIELTLAALAAAGSVPANDVEAAESIEAFSMAMPGEERFSSNIDGSEEGEILAFIEWGTATHTTIYDARQSRGFEDDSALRFALDEDGSLVDITPAGEAE